MTELQSSTHRQAGRGESTQATRFRVVNVTGSKQALDHALEETFPASDPVSITISLVVRVHSKPEFPN
jgi:hypothetical protein